MTPLSSIVAFVTSVVLAWQAAAGGRVPTPTPQAAVGALEQRLEREVLTPLRERESERRAYSRVLRRPTHELRLELTPARPGDREAGFRVVSVPLSGSEREGGLVYRGRVRLPDGPVELAHEAEFLPLAEVLGRLPR